MKPGRPAIFGTLLNVHDLHCRIKETLLFPFSEDFDTVKQVPETVNQGHQDDVTDAIDQIDPFDVYLLYQQHGLQSNSSLSTPQDTSDTPIHEPVKRTNTLILREPKCVKFESQSRSFANTPKNQEPMDPVSQPTTRSSNPRHNQRAIIASKAPEETSDSRINAAFVLLVGTLCLALPTDLKWNQIQRQITRQCGKANIRSIVDGGLVDPNGECRIIIEVKAQTPDNCKNLEVAPYASRPRDGGLSCTCPQVFQGVRPR